MSQIIKFTPKRELSCQQNLNHLIALARDNLTIWSTIDGFAWNANRWPTTHKGIRFINFEHRNLHHSKLSEPHQLMHPAFIEVAKAYLRYKHTVRPTKHILPDICALRVIEFALRQDMTVPDITKFQQRHWDRAISALEPMANRQQTAYTMRQILMMLSDLFILSVDPSYWRNPYVGQHSYDAANGTRATDEARAKKIPNQDALLAVAEVFSRGASETLEDTDVMVTSITALLMSAPMRFSETLRFRTDCLRDDLDKNGTRQYYLAYWVPKTRQFTRKAIPKTMAEVTKEAINRLTIITEESRQLARYMETNPTKFYRHANCPNVPDDQQLTSDQVVQALGLRSKNSCEDFLKRVTGKYALKGFTLDTLWQLVLKEHLRLNPHFPYQEALDSPSQPRLKMSESLLCFLRHQLSRKNHASPVLLAPFNVNFYWARLSAGSENVPHMNFFAKQGYKTNKLKSHSLRHLLTRLGRISNIPVDTLTDWSSRATIRQTRTYLQDNPATAAAKGAVVLGTAKEQQPHKPITGEESALYNLGPFHRSRYGICRRSWRVGPCNKFADCLNCSELLMCKGDRIASEIIKTDRDNLVQTYTAAQNAIANGERAASRWTEKARPQIERLDQLIAIFDNPDIPDGSPIEMAGEDFSHEKVIMSEKAKAAGVNLLDRSELGLTYGDDLLACLELLWGPDNA
jgi:hypothetical protein